MSVIIPGVKFPKTCWACQFNGGHHSDRCFFTHNLTDDPYYAKNKQPACPLIELPTPHGRLVDIDAEVKKHDCVPILGEHLKLMAKHMTTVIKSEE